MIRSKALPIDKGSFKEETIIKYINVVKSL